MKKIIAVLLSVTVLAGVFAACSGKADSNQNEGSNVAIGIDGNELTTKYREKKHTTTVASISTTSGKKIDSAKISAKQASLLIQSYSDEELGLTKEERQLCSIIVSDVIEEVDKDEYIKIMATIKIAHIDQNTGEKTYTTDNKGEYYLQVKGKKLLKKDLETGKFTEMKLKEIPKE